MNLKLVRRINDPEFCIGEIFINGKYFCDSLEDTDRGLTSEMSEDEIKRIKITGKTAIPIGKYKLTKEIYSTKFGNKPYYKQRFGGYMPRLLNVKGFEGVLIHPGNTSKDTSGCILCGKNTEIGKVTSSRKYFEELYDLLDEDNEIEISNNYEKRS